MTACKTDSADIGKIPYVSEKTLETDGKLTVKVESSAYNVTSLRTAMINSAALTAMQSAQGDKNCYTAHYDIKQKRGLWPWDMARRWTGLEPRDFPHNPPQPESATWCNAASFAGVQYYDQYWRLAANPGSTSYIDARWDFQAGPDGTLECEFIEGLIDALAALEPEFAVEDVGLGEAVGAACAMAMDHAKGS